MNKPMEKGLVPELRFPEFQGMSEWEASPLSTFLKSLDAGVSVNSGDRPAKSSEAGILKTSAVTNGIFDSSENKAVLVEHEINRLKEPVTKNTIIISRMNTPVLVGANAYINNNFKNLYLPDRLWAAKPKPNTEMRFIASILSSDKGRKALSELGKGTSGSMKNITKTDVLNLQILAPRLPEQQKIADCLSSLDELLSAHNQKLDALKAHKKGLMQQLFPAEGETVPKLRFPEFDTEWKPHVLSKIGNVITGNTPSTTEKANYGGDKLFVSPADISGKRFIINTKTTLSDSGFSKTRKIPENSILFVCIGSTIGKIAQNRVECATNQQINSVIPFGDFVAGFIYYALERASPVIAELAGKQAVPIINKTLFSSVTLKIPIPKEQQKIADCLSAIDELITVQSQKIEALKTHKKGLMQQLFPSIDNAHMDAKAEVGA
ncbi:restriction endonuclease subunit S [Shewanella sp.]|uniref:restriction endonuclease subunit S n=1 Tax=Shewanella sp. TaxID=50422 RepID=UPI00405446F6